jgi:hypothetical protein
VVVALIVVAALGPDGLPKENGRTGTPWYGFLAVAGLGLLFVLIGGYGAVVRRAMSVADDREFTGGKAVLIGGLQCVAGGAAIGFAIYGLALLGVVAGRTG